MRQIYSRTPMSKCDFSKIAKQFYWNRISPWVFFCKIAAYFQNTFSLEHPWRAGSDSNKLVNLLHAIVKFIRDPSAITCFYC